MNFINKAFILVLIFAASDLFAGNKFDDTYNSFINALINNDGRLSEFVYPPELKISGRLGIMYPDSKYKFLISNEPDDITKSDMRSGALEYFQDVKTLEPGYDVLTLNLPSKNISYQYYFYNGRLISKPYYYGRDWAIINSKYFVFHTSNKNLINGYSIIALDSFVDRMLALLKFDKSDIDRLRKEKIHYYLCRDQAEIEQLTNYGARGLYYMPYDYIISTYNCHYHELLHLLMNYKLKTVSTYTLPLLQEGFAVAYGGRGGQNAEVLQDMGRFIEKSGLLDYHLLLNRPDFFNYDATMSYPVSGLYVRFLINALGINKFLAIYKKYSGSGADIINMNISPSDLPSDAAWQSYLKNSVPGGSVSVSGFDENDFKKAVIDTDSLKVYESGDSYLFRIMGAAGLKGKETFKSFESSQFIELFPQAKYTGEKYLITAGAEEVSVYNLFTNDLLAKYAAGFSQDNEPVSSKDGYFVFTVKKNVFDEQLTKATKVFSIF